MTSTFTTPLTALQQALRATIGIKPEPDELPRGLGEIVIDGQELMQLTRHIAIRFALPSDVTTFEGEAFVIPPTVRKALLAVPASKARGATVSISVDAGTIRAHAGDLVDATEPDYDGALPPHQRMFRDYPLVESGRSVRAVAHTQTRVAPDWRIGFNPQLFALLAPYSKREHGAALELTFFGQRLPVHFSFGDGLDGLIMPTTIAR
jgi:hypothetical protein